MELDSLIFRSFASGSSGNCYYLGTPSRGVLIDAGISARAIQKHLSDMGLGFGDIMGVLITHDHADHIRAVGALGERFHLPIYGTRLIHSGIDRNYGVQTKLRTSRKFFEKGSSFEIGGMRIQTFGISHDSTECVGYVIDYKKERFMIATDVGCLNPDLLGYLGTADHVVIEANHDEQMLLNGAYPTYLKERILSDTGHMSNTSCANALAEKHSETLSHVFLCHLSEENNDPQLAYNMVYEAMSNAGINMNKVHLKALDRLNPSEIYELKH